MVTRQAEADIEEAEVLEKNRAPVALFPYRIRNRELFYDREHPRGLHPGSQEYQEYWGGERLRGFVEGRWVQDIPKGGKEGTWVFLPPKLNFYCNYLWIVDEDRNSIQPWMRDVEWIVFSYILCCDGFSGFEDDPDYTSHELVGRLARGETLRPFELARIPDSALREDGEYKTYVDPWTFLTRFYLLDKPRGPLGRPRYDNERSNGMLFSGRGIGKSLCVFVGDFIHEFTFSGVRYWEDRLSKDAFNKRLLFAMAATDMRPLSRSIANISAAMTMQPGSYRFNRDSSGRRPPPCDGAYAKQTQGAWGVGSEVTHLIKRPDNSVEVEGCMVQTMQLGEGRTKVAAGDRFRRIYLEEGGFIGNLIDIMNANDQSLALHGKQVGSCFITGTGGDLEKIQQPKRMFQNPKGYKIFAIPDYWNNSDKGVGLFIPAYYKFEEFRDAHGNLDHEEALRYLLEEREEALRTVDSVTYASRIMFDPIEPEEMLRPSGSSVMPKQEAAEQLADLHSSNHFERRAMVGKLAYDKSAPQGVRFDKDTRRELDPILTLDTGNRNNFEGAFVMYEQPAERIPEGLYWVLFDPVAQDGTGSSLNSLMVYKYIYNGSEATIQDNFVAEWIGRHNVLEETYDLVIRVAKFFNAKIFPETNTHGFVAWANAKGFGRMLEGDAFTLERSLNPRAKRNHYQVGVRMDTRKKGWALQRFRSWVLEVKETDPRTDLPTVRTINRVPSQRLLEEMISFSEDGNFDHISAAILLPFLLAKLDGTAPVDLLEYEDADYETPAYLQEQAITPFTHRQRCKFLSY